ncbi:hypothetical protein M378DRAFT_668298 [Amanita muscaria Koide BX008]|uniref:Uncharacterized protein n=1 Tax=Amanita muscaria (strain Koide BX008) TaxID=946122 RepID=A0A0C2RXB3_AMAMK|nr:hypothetical protein M378DRAFT_668298 [Amanita muscaria Koide BX008]
MATRILDIFHAKEQIESTSCRAPMDIKTLTGLRLRGKLFSKVSLVFSCCNHSFTYHVCLSLQLFRLDRGRCRCILASKSAVLFQRASPRHR